MLREGPHSLYADQVLMINNKYDYEKFNSFIDGFYPGHQPFDSSGVRVRSLCPRGSEMGL